MNTHLITRWSRTLALGVILLAWMIAPQQVEAKNNMGVSFQVFYDELAPYGDWVKDARYGYIWLPAVRQDFHPYGTEGHWVMTEYGNTWISYYDWGWAPFHYGRWYFDDYFQSWAWIPGYKWGPAWVNWRAGGGYYGWAPLAPVSIYFPAQLPSNYWVFIPNHRIHHHYAYRYYAPYPTRVKVYNNTTIINNTVVYNNHRYMGGPQPKEIERVTRKVVPVYNLDASDAPGRVTVSKNSVNLYRPEVRESRGETRVIQPSRVMDAQQAKTTREAQSSPLRSTSPNVISDSKTVESPSRVAQNSSISGGNAAPSRSTSPSENDDKKTTVTPMYSPSQRSTTTTSSRTQPLGTRETTPARAPEIKKEDSRTQQSAPARGTVQQPKPTQAPTRSQSPEVIRTEPSRTQNSRTTSEEKIPTSEKKSTTETKGRTSSTSSGRTASSGRNN